MGTRGLFGFVVDGQVKAGYNHFDSYPEGLGRDVLDFVRNVNLKVRKGQAQLLQLVEETSEPTPEQIEKLKEFADVGVASGRLNDWYVLLRNNQGDLIATLNSGYLIDGNNFAADSLFCEYGYLVNFDNETVECYSGFQHEPHQSGRFANFPIRKSNSGDYYPIKLVGSLSFEDVKAAPDIKDALRQLNEFYPSEE